MADIYNGNLQMNDDWGNVIVEGGAKGIPASGEAIQRFIKDHLQNHEMIIDNKPSVFYSIDDNANNQNVMLAFKSNEDMEAWKVIWEAEGKSPLEGIDDSLVLTSTRMNKAEPKPYYSVILENHTPTGNTYVSTDNRVVLSLKFVSTYYAKVGNSLQPQTIIEDGSIYFERRKNNGEAWAPLVQNVPISSIASAGENDGPIDVDLTSALTDGYQEVRVMVVGTTSKESTPWMQFNITKTQLKLEFDTDWATPQSNGVINLKYKISGEVDKVLNVRILGEEEDRIIAKPIGDSEYTTVSYELEPIRDAASDKVKVITHGVKTIESWLSLAGNDKVTSDHIVSQVMVVTEPSDETPHIILGGFTINDVEEGPDTLTTTLTNWTNQSIFKYSLYHPTKDKIPFSMELKGFNEDDSFLSADYPEVETNKITEYRNIIEIEANDPMIYAELKFYSDGMLLTDPISVSIDNTGGYSPTAGADIIINPRSRSNDEAEVATIINTVDKSVIPSTWTGFDFSRDGWTTDNDGNRCLRILSGQELTIDYPLFTGWSDADATNNSCTIEFSFATRNISDETTPIIRMCRYNEAGRYNGWEQRALEAVYMTENKYDSIKQDVWFSEGVMTHVAINIVDKLINGQSFCRIFVNGRINREFTYNESTLGDVGQNALAANARKIIFGNTKNGCDLDIYGFRVYKKKLNSSDILQDYISNLPTVEEKQIEKVANAITNKNGEIDYDLASKYYNTLLWKFNDQDTETRMVGLAESVTLVNGQPSGGDTKSVKKKGDLVIKVFKIDANGRQITDPNTGLPILDKERSGTINNMTAKGQGTSSMYYWKWNQRWEFKEYDQSDYEKGYRNSVFTPLSLSENYDFVENISWEKNKDDEFELVNNSKWVSKEKDDLNQPIETIDDKRKAAWQPQEGMPYAARLDGKINFASPMQSHKLGSVCMYNDLWKDIVKDNEITAIGATENGKKFTGTNDGYKSCRVAVVQRPFLVFCQKKSGDPIEFYGLYTMGPSKGDKPTFGYNKKDFPNFVMMEGCDNGAKLVRCLVPWNDIDIKPEEVDDDGEKVFEIFYIGKDEQWEISMGSTGVKKVCSVTEVEDENGIKHNEYGPVGSGSNPVFAHFREMINFCYQLNPRLKCWDKGDGDYASLMKAQNKELNDAQGNPITPDTGYVYWTIKGTAIPTNKVLNEGVHYIYNTYRYDGDKAKWVHCGVEYDSTGNDYVPLNISVQTGYTPTTGTRDAQNQNFIDKRVQIFKGGMKNYVDERDMQYSLGFLKLIAASDNWAKNTYIYNAGLTDADGKLTSKWRFFQDDLDTILSLDNSGYKVKPYYVEEHDSYVNDKGETVGYWNASDNAMYCLAEKAWENENRAMMREILGAMKNRAGSTFGSSPEGCFDKYYGEVTRYIPAIAYNEITRKLYEDAEVNRQNGLYTYGNTVDPLAQAVGDQLQAEAQWQKQRSTYLSSYASYGIFASGSESQDGSLAFRAGGSEGSSTEMRFIFKPSMWLYPSMANGSSSVNGVVLEEGDTPNYNFNPQTIANPPRVKPGQSILFKTTATADQTVTIRGIDYYTDIGDLGQVTASSKYGFPLSGRKLEQFKITDDNGKIILLPSSLSTPTTGMDNIKRIEIRGQVNNNVSIIGGEMDLSGLWRLNYVDVTASSITAIKLPSKSGITTLKLPATLTNVKFEDQPKLVDLSIAGVRSVKDLTISKCPTLNSYDLFNRIYTAGVTLNSCYIDGIEWVDVTISQLNYLAGIYDCTLKGVITLKDKEVLDFNTKAAMLAKFGNIDDPENALVINYEVREFDQTSARIVGESYITVDGEYSYKISVNDGNNFKSIEWSLSDKTYADINPATGVLTYRNVESDIERKTQIICNIEIPNASGKYFKFKIEKTIYFDERVAEVGDYVYADGTISAPSDYNSDKDVIGICFYVNPSDKYDRLMVAVNNIEQSQWGLTSGDGGVDGLNAYYDVPNLNSVTSLGISANSIHLDDIWDSTNEVFKTYAQAQGLGEFYNVVLAQDLTTEDKLYNPSTVKSVGSSVPKGLKNALDVIEHRNENILKSADISFTGKRVPGKDNDVDGGYYYLEDEKSDLENILTRAASPLYFYPATSRCWAYEPTAKDMDVKFKKHNWWLPTIAELSRIWYCWKAGVFTRPVKDGVFVDCSSKTYWTSSEQSATQVWYLEFSNSADYAWAFYGAKSNSQQVRPVTRF